MTPIWSRQLRDYIGEGLFISGKQKLFKKCVYRNTSSINKIHTSKKSPITQSGHRKRSRRPFQMTRVCKMFKIIQNFYFLEFHGKQTNRGQFLTILDKIVFFCLFLRFWVFFTICFSKCINNGNVETLGFTFIC